MMPFRVVALVLWGLISSNTLQTIVDAHGAFCHVCPDFSDPFNPGVDCQRLINTANALNATATTECAAVQQQADTLECCTTVDSTTTTPPTTPTDAPTMIDSTTPPNTAATPCNFCENGDPLPNPDLPVSDLTCRQVQNFASSGSSPASCTNFQATTGQYCGCDNPVASQFACRICAAPSNNNNTLDTTKLVDVSILGFVDARHCGTVEFFSQYFITSVNFPNAPLSDCAAYQEAFGDLCCSTTDESDATTSTASPNTMTTPTNVPSAASPESTTTLAPSSAVTRAVTTSPFGTTNTTTTLSPTPSNNNNTPTTPPPANLDSGVVVSHLSAYSYSLVVYYVGCSVLFLLFV